MEWNGTSGSSLVWMGLRPPNMLDVGLTGVLDYSMWSRGRMCRESPRRFQKFRRLYRQGILIPAPSDKAWIIHIL